MGLVVDGPERNQSTMHQLKGIRYRTRIQTIRKESHLKASNSYKWTMNAQYLVHKQLKQWKKNITYTTLWHSSQPHMEKVEMLQLTVSSTDTPWKLKGKQITDLVLNLYSIPTYWALYLSTDFQLCINCSFRIAYSWFVALIVSLSKK